MSEDVDREPFGERERWNARHAGDRAALRPEPHWIEARLARDTGGRALDVAAGRGRAALLLARAGYETWAVDISDVALAMTATAAEERGLVVHTERLDLERDPPPKGPFHVITCLFYKQPALWPLLADRLAPNGLLFLEQPTLRNLELHARPSERFLLREGTFEEWMRGHPELRIEHLEEGLVEGRYLARLAARRRA